MRGLLKNMDVIIIRQILVSFVTTNDAQNTT